MAYYAVEPFGEERADLRNAIVAVTMANAYRDPKRHRPFSIDDFMPEFERVEEPQLQGWQQQLGIVESLNIAFGGEDLRANSGDDSDADGQD